MLIICPDCETSYEVEPSDLGEGGRKVRCNQCGALWHAQPDPGDDMPAGDEVPEVSVEQANVLSDEDFASPARTEEPVEDITPPEKPERRRRARGTAPRAAAKPRFISIVAAAGIAVLAALGVWREAVVRVVPDLAGLYAAAGLPVNLRGLEFRDMTTVETMENGVPQLVVRGTIANVRDEDAEVPRLRLAVRSVSGREIFVWTAMPGRAELKGGETSQFFAQLASPPAEGRDVAVRFLSARDVRQGASAR